MPSKSYDVGNLQWLLITAAGESAVCFKKTGDTVVIDHTTTEGDAALPLTSVSVAVNKSKRVPLDKNKSGVLEIPADTALDSFYALTVNPRSDGPELVTNPDLLFPLDGWNKFGPDFPAVRDKVLVWMPGQNEDDTKADAYPLPGTFPMIPTQSACVGLNGVDETGDTSSDFGALVSYQGTATLSYDGTTITATAGTAYDLRFANGRHFPLSEVNGKFSFDTLGEHHIEWITSDLPQLRSFRQDDYHYNTIDHGYGKLIGTHNGVVLDGSEHLPFLQDFPAGTNNYPECKWNFEEVPVGTFNGVDDVIEGGRLDTGDLIIVEFDMLLLSEGARATIVGQHFTDWEIEVTNFSGIATSAVVFWGDGSGNINVSLTYPSGNILDGVIHHYRFVIDKASGTVSMYQDDYPVVSLSNTPLTGYDPSKKLTLGARSGRSLYTNCILRNVSIDNTVIALNEGEGLDIHDQFGVKIGDLIASDVGELIVRTPLYTFMYLNGTKGTLEWYGDERHGIVEDGQTHLMKHQDLGFFIASGVVISGILNNGTTFTGISGGGGGDEDVKMFFDAVATMPKMYKEGASGEWAITDDDNLLGVRSGGLASYNKDTAGTWSLESLGTDYVVMTVIATNNKLYPVVAVVGQTLYANRSDARDHAQEEWYRINDEGLPVQEVERIASYIIQGTTGKIETGADGEVYIYYKKRDAIPFHA